MARLFELQGTVQALDVATTGTFPSGRGRWNKVGQQMLHSDIVSYLFDWLSHQKIPLSEKINILYFV